MTADPLIGQILDGRHEIIEPNGKGGMGIVYRARQLSVNSAPSWQSTWML